MWVSKAKEERMEGDCAVTVSENGNLRWKPTSCNEKHNYLCDIKTSVTGLDYGFYLFVKIKN